MTYTGLSATKYGERPENHIGLSDDSNVLMLDSSEEKPLNKHNVAIEPLN